MIPLNLQYKEIYPLIYVYTNLLEDYKKLSSIVKMSESFSEGKYHLRKWNPWFIFGTYTDEKGAEEKKDFENNMYENELYLCNRVTQATNSATCHYIAANNIILPENSYLTKANFAKYDPNVSVGVHEHGSPDGLNRSLSMNYHTDYAIGEWYWPNDKFFITCTSYINDDYEGGELRFFINGEIITYKPKAGEIVVFPSGSPLYPGNHPYFHAVGIVECGEKFFTRSYVKHSWHKTELWIEGEEKYGQEEWPEIAKELLLEDNTLHFHYDPIKEEKKYKNVTVWQSPLVEKLYKNI